MIYSHIYVAEESKICLENCRHYVSTSMQKVKDIKQKLKQRAGIYKIGHSGQKKMQVNSNCLRAKLFI